MLGVYHAHAPTFLWVIGLLMIVALLPMALWPLQWARVIGWQIPADNHLAIYYGRCLGCVATAAGVFAIVAAGDPVTVSFYLPFLLTLWVLMVVAHVWGAIRRIQPLTESLEIGFWAALAGVTLLFLPPA